MITLILQQTETAHSNLLVATNHPLGHGKYKNGLERMVVAGGHHSLVTRALAPAVKPWA